MSCFLVIPDVETSIASVDTILGLFAAPLEWRQTVKSCDEHGLENLLCYYKFGKQNEFAVVSVRCLLDL